MPRFFFHLYDHLIAEDEEGINLPDVEAAVAYALQGARSVAAAHVQSGRLDLNSRIEIATEDGRVLQSVSFADAVEVRLSEEATRQVLARG